MSYTQNLKGLGGAILDLVFPVACLVCGREKTYLCDDCTTKLSRLDNQQCLVCQTPSPYGKTHPQCVTRNSVDGAISALNHKNKTVRDVIKIFKYDFVSNLSKPLAQTIVDTTKTEGLGDYFSDFVIVPVPLHPRRTNWRGFNQALLLSESLAVELGMKIENSIISRKKFTKPQVNLTANERKRNISNAFELSGNVNNKKILLVDDVITSGSTANEIAKVLKRGGAAEVWVISAAHG